MPVEINDADGWLDIQIAGRDPVRVDLFIANDRFFRAYEGATDDDEPKLFERLCEVAKSLGFGDVSGRTAKFIAEAVFTRVGELRKKAESPVQTQ
jgi:hypothetical protein